MIAQRALPAFRQFAPISRARAVPLVGRRMESTASDKPKAKLTFRFGPKDVPVELWPMGAVVVAGVIGAGFAISRHFYKDDDLRLHRNAPPTK